MTEKLKNVLIWLGWGLPVALILYWALPGLLQGTSNINMILHFDGDEAYIVRWASEIYSKIVIPWDRYGAYPSLFYVIAGIVLVPFTIIKGIDAQAIVIVLRLLSLASFILCALGVYFIGSKVFSSRLAGFLGAFLLVLTPEAIWWTVNSRPHLLAVFFLLAGLFFCIKMALEYDKKYFYWALVLSVLAFCTDYTGLFLLPLVLALKLLFGFKPSAEDIEMHLKSQSVMVYGLSAISLLSGLLLPFASRYAVNGFVIAKSSGKTLAQYSPAAASLVSNLSLAASVVLILAPMVWLAAYFYLKKQATGGSLVKDNRMAWVLLYANEAFLTGCYIFAVLALVYLLLNPSIIFYPVSYFMQAGYLFLGLAMGWVGATTYISPNRFEWIPIIASSRVLGVSGLILFLLYLIWEAAGYKENISKDKTVTINRLVILSYVFLFLVVNFLFVSMRKHHYLIPVLPPVFLLIGLFLDGLWKRVRYKSLNYFVLALFLLSCGLAALSLYEHFPIWANWREAKAEVNKDTALELANWLEANITPDSRIWVDSNNYYIPPVFKSVRAMLWNDDLNRHLDEIRSYNPDIVIITSQYDPDLTNAKKFKNALSNYSLIGCRLLKKEVYKGPYSLGVNDFGKYKEILIFGR